MFVFFLLFLSNALQLLGTDLYTNEVFGDENAPPPPFARTPSRDGIVSESPELRSPRGPCLEDAPRFPFAPLVDRFDAFKAAYTESRLKDRERVLALKDEKRKSRAAYENLKPLFDYLKNDNLAIQRLAFQELFGIAQDDFFPLIPRLDIAISLYLFQSQKSAPEDPLSDEISSIMNCSATSDVYLFLYHHTLFFEDPFHFENRVIIFPEIGAELPPPPSITPENFLLLLRDLHKTLETLY